MAEVLQGGVRDTVYKDSSGTEQKFVITNFNEDFDFDCNAGDVNVTSDVLATLIQTLIRKGIINGTIA